MVKFKNVFLSYLDDSFSSEAKNAIFDFYQDLGYETLVQVFGEDINSDWVYLPKTSIQDKLMIIKLAGFENEYFHKIKNLDYSMDTDLLLSSNKNLDKKLDKFIEEIRQKTDDYFIDLRHSFLIKKA